MSYVAESVIMGVFSLLTVLLLNRNWFRRAQLRHDLAMEEIDKKYRIEKKKIAAKQNLSIAAATPLEAGVNKLGNWSQYLPLLQNLDSDQISDLIGVFTGEEKTIPKGTIAQILEVLPPDVIQNFIKGFMEKQGGGDDSTFVSQG